MKKLAILVALAGSAGLCVAQGAAQGVPQGIPQDTARVLSSTPVISQVGVPRRVCTNESVPTQSQKSGAGAVMGGLAGGAIGNAIGGGGGRAAATMLGIFGGAILGDRIEGGGQTQYQTVQNCTSQTFYENRTTGYNVVYEYAGKQHSVQMPNDPGPFVRLQITPVGATQYPGAPATQYQGTPPQVFQPQTGLQQDTTPYVQQDRAETVQTYSTTVVTQQQQQQQVVPVYGAAPVVVYPAVYPAYYARPYYPPIGINLNLGWSGGHYGHGSRHGHSR